MSEVKIQISEVLDVLKDNTSSIFLLDPLNLSYRELKSMGFVSSFLKDADNPTDIDRPLFLLFKPEQFEKLELFIREQYKRKDEVLQKDYDYEGGYTVLLYSFPEKWRSDYKLFMYGKYSKFSKEFTNLFSKKIIVEGIQHDTLQYMIITKDENWIETLNTIFNSELTKEDELWKIPDLEKETLNIKEIREKEKP